MASDPTPWMRAWRTSQDNLTAAVEPLTVEQLEQRSYDPEWSIAQVLSHIGSSAEIFGLLLEAGTERGRPAGTGRVRTDLGALEHPERAGPSD